MALFQNTVINKYLSNQDKHLLAEKWTIYKSHFLNSTVQENIRSSKEEQYQEGFIVDLFVNVLDYTQNPNPNFNITTEIKNVKDSKKADGGILINGQIVGVIELKGTKTTDFDKIEKQAFGYKNNQPNCVYVITSNFEKLRFYIDNAIEYQTFNLFQLTEKEFALLYLCLAFENIKNDIPKQLKQESLSQEDKITKQLYKDYSDFKRVLYQNLTELNPEFDGLQLLKYTQKLLDRFLFLFFAEDRQLLPPNSVRLIISDWKDLAERDVEMPLYDRFKKYFEYLNEGSKRKRYDVFAYNGGLFLPDAVLDKLKIDDNLLAYHTQKLADYDFLSEVDVNILGHIFENSLNEMDEIKAQTEGTTLDKTQTKRKKDGIFYTPKYITNYIIENTVGKLCAEKKAEIMLAEEDYFTDKKRPQKAKQALLEKLETYRNWLLQITIIDPACGSGAFLNEALNFLIQEHLFIDELQSKLFGDALVLSDVQKSILENNLFGVDLNDESVEIAKLSLWLRTAQPNRKLNNLNNNIKCGNSLIDDPLIAGKKAFHWQTEFPQVFANGGFDVVVGNPPYVRQELLGETMKTAYSKAFPKVYNGVADLYVYFYNKGIDILKKDGILGYITPNKWLERKYGFELRQFLKPLKIENLIDYGELRVFEDASTEPAIIILTNTTSDEAFAYATVKSLKTAQDPNLYEFKNIDKNKLRDDIWRFASDTGTSILEKFAKDTISLADYTNGGVYYGIKTGFNQAFIINQETRDSIVKKDANAAEILRKEVEGEDFGKWYLKHTGKYMIFFPRGEKNVTDFPSIEEFLKPFYEDLKPKTNNDIKGRKPGSYKWFETQDIVSYYKKFEKPKLVYYHTALNHGFYYDTEGYYISANCYFIANADRYLQCILNSKMFHFCKKYLFPSFGDAEKGGRIRLDANKMVTLPIKQIDTDLKQKFTLLAEKITADTADFQTHSTRFLRLLQSSFPNLTVNKKIENWHDMTFGEFRAALEQQKIKIPIKELMDYQDLFETNAALMHDLQRKIRATDTEIDNMVYALYGLTEAEIETVSGK